AYPRTDSRYITEDEKSMLEDNLEYISEVSGSKLNNKLTNSSLINPSKIDDHYAILVTGENYNEVNLTEKEKKVYLSILINIAK
ncbi:DNA topoisomerase III, partial [Staphylococcus aureus]|nr:DNA topoisomerase III [Staphylococcus aureus]